MTTVESATVLNLLPENRRTESGPALRPLLATELLKVARPLHWAKNVLVVPAALLTAPTVGLDGVSRIGGAVLAFTLASIAVYLGNDLADLSRDRSHPVKRFRPIASGRIPVPVAVGYCLAVLGLLAVVLRLWPAVSPWPVLAYLGLNVLYSRGLKHVPLVDAGCVAAGFGLRLLAGYLALGTAVPSWLLVAVFSLCLLLVLGKRRQELSAEGAQHRPALRGYSIELTDHLLQLTAVLTAVSFLLYLRGETQLGAYAQPAMLVSVPLALFCLSRYLQVVLMHGGVADPVLVLLRDRAIVTAALLWGLLFTSLLVLAHDPVLAHRLHTLVS